MMNIKTLQNKTVFKAELFEVKETHLRLQSGEKRIYHDVFRHPTVLVFPLTETGELYLITQFRYLYNSFTIEAIAGHIEKKESALSAGRRELKEEAGIEAGVFEEFGRLDASGSVVKSSIYLFLAKDLTVKKSEAQEDEHIEVIKIPLYKAVKMIFTGEIKNSATVAGILMLYAMGRKRKV